MAEAFDMKLTVDASEFLNNMTEVEQSILKTKAAVSTLNLAFSAMQTVTMAGALSLGVMAAPTLLATQALKDYDSNLRRIIALGGEDLKGRMNDISEAITDISVKYGIASEDIASGIIEFVKSGETNYEILKSLMEGTAQLAITNQETFKTASQITIYAYKLFGDEVENTYDLMEKMHVAANDTMMDINDLKSAFEYAGSSFAVTNITFNEFLAAMGALSNVAYESSENVGTFINRILTKGNELEQILGLSPGSIVSEGRINLTNLMNAFGNVADKTKLLEWGAKEWGVRSVKVIAALLKVTEDYNKVLSHLSEDTKELENVSTFMAGSLENVMARIKETLLAPLKEENVLTALSDALQTIADTIKSAKVGDILAEFIYVSADFIETYGPELINTFINFLNILMQLLPNISELAKFFMWSLDAMSKMPKEIFLLITSFMILSKIIPFDALFKYIILINNATISVESHRRKINELTLAQRTLIGAGILGIVSGFMMLISSSDPLVKAIGAIITVISALATAMFILKAVASGGLLVPQMLSALLIGLPLFAGLTAAALSYQTPTIPEVSVPTITSGTNVIVNNDYRTYEINEANKDDLYNSIVKEAR